MSKPHICPVHNDCDKKACQHSIAHNERFDCYMKCFNGITTISGVGCVKFMLTIYETAPIVKTIISKDTPKATRYHIRNNE